MLKSILNKRKLYKKKELIEILLKNGVTNIDLFYKKEYGWHLICETPLFDDFVGMDSFGAMNFITKRMIYEKIN